jgi:hypothetical protein
MSVANHDPAGSPAFKVDFPPAFGYDHLSILLGRTVASLQRDRYRKPNTLPPACTPPGTKIPRWLLTDVLAWLAQHREMRSGNRGSGGSMPARVGRPTKSQQVAARRATEASA